MTTAIERVMNALRTHGSRQRRDMWTCPAHDDAHPSLSVSEGEDGRALLYCQAGCPTERIVGALGLQMSDLFSASAPAIRRNGDGKPGAGTHGPGTAYLYKDEQGQVVFRVIRGPIVAGKKSFGQHPPDGKGGWRTGTGAMDGVRRVLYRLPELLAADPNAPVFLAEGEKDCLSLAALGLIATTNPGGAGNWGACERQGQGQFTGPLRGRHVVILPDCDDAGRHHADEVATRLTGIAASIKVLPLPGLPKKGDVSDWLQQGGTAGELRRLAEAAPLWGAIEGGSADGNSSPHPSQAKQLVDRALRAGIELFHDQRDDPFVALEHDGGRRILAVGSRDVGLWLRQLAWKQLDVAPTSEVISTARHTLGSMARFDGPRHALHVRVAWHEGAIWLDLDGQAAVRVVPGGWELVDRPPLLFRWYSHQRPLPRPTGGGDIETCLHFLRIVDAKTKLLFLCYLVAALVPEIPVAALIVHGVQGATKTSLLKVVKRLLDPSAVEVRGGVRDLTEFAQAAAQNRILFFDNLTSVPDWLSDALCRAVTGEGWSKRSLYTDEDSTVFEYRGVVGLAGINVVADRADLLDRAVIIPLEPVPYADRKAERRFWEEFEAVRPAILGGILDVLAQAMSIEPSLVLPQLPRMADFARWGAAAAAALGHRPEEFLDAYRENAGRQNDAAVEASPIAQAILGLMESCPEWEGSSSELLTALETAGTRLRLNLRDREWPKGPNWVARRIRQVQPNLLALGIEFGEERTHEHRSLCLRRTERAVAFSSSSRDSMTALRSADTDAVTDNAQGENGLGGCDSSDSIFASLKGREEEEEGDAWERYEERAAILEFEALMDRPRAEQRARALCIATAGGEGGIAA